MSNLPSVEHSSCKKCLLYKTCNHPFMSMESKGDEVILFVGEAPGKNEDEQGVPFVGKSGKLLRDIVDGLDVPVAYTNTVRCRPVDNETPTTKQINFCNEFLIQDILDSPAKYVILLGNTALKAVMGYSGVEAWHGKVLNKYGKKIIATYHPSAVLRNNHLEGDFLDDMSKVLELMEGIEEQPADYDFEYKIVSTLQEARDMFQAIKEAGKCAYDLEFISLSAFKEGNAILAASFAIPNKAYAIPLYHKECPFTEVELLEILDLFEEFLTGDTAKIGHNIKIDSLLPLATMGTRIKNVVGDTMLISQVVDSRHGIHDLKQLAGKYLKMHGYEIELEDYVSTHPDANYDKGGNYGNVPLNILLPYAAKDTSATLLLEPILLNLLDEKQKNYYYEILVPEIEVFTRMEANGCKLDINVIKEYTAIYEAKNDELLEKMREYPVVKKLEKGMNDKVDAKRKNKLNLDPSDPRWIKFNPGSSDQAIIIIYDYLKFKVKWKTETGRPSVKAEAIKWLEHPWLDLYREWKLYRSALTKNLYTAEEWIDKDGRIRSNYNIIGTETFRTSSSDPNLQNIPTPEKQPGTLLEKYPIKNIFTNTWEGGCILAVDYSGIELRVMASQCGSPLMQKTFNEGGDLHRIVSAKVFNVPEEKVTKDMRYSGKIANWTMQYGGGWSTMMDTYNLKEEDAKNLEAVWHTMFPEVMQYGEEVIKFTRKYGYAVSPFGMKRYFPYIKNASNKMIAESERAAANHPIQHAASALLIMALVVILNIMKAHKMKSLIINTVHDSIMFDIFPGELEELYKIVKDVMINLKIYAKDYFPSISLDWLTVPLDAEFEVGSHYGSLQEYHLKEN